MAKIRRYNSAIGPQPNPNISTSQGEGFSTPGGKVIYPQSIPLRGFGASRGGGGSGGSSPQQSTVPQNQTTVAQNNAATLKASQLAQAQAKAREEYLRSRAYREKEKKRLMNRGYNQTQASRTVSSRLSSELTALNKFNRENKQFQRDVPQVISSKLPQEPGGISLNLSPSNKNKVYRFFYNTLNVYSGGKLTEKKLNKLQEDLNKKVLAYEKKYPSNSSLSQKDYAASVAEYTSLVTLQNAIDKAKKGKGNDLKKLVENSSSKSKLINILERLGLSVSPGSNKRRVQAQSIGAGSAFAEFLINTYDTPGLVKGIIKNPPSATQLWKGVKGVPSNLKNSFLNYVEIAKVNPNYVVAKLATKAGIEYYTLKGTSKGLSYAGKITKNTAVKLVPSFRYRGVVEGVFGERAIPNVAKVGNIEIVRPRGTKLVTSPALASEIDISSQLKRAPTLAKPNSLVEKKLIDIVKKEGDAIGGSYAQESLLKKAFTNKHKDLDIITSTRDKLIKTIKKEIPGAKFVKRKVSIEVRYKGKAIADLIEFSKAEAKLAKKYGYVKVKGVNIISPQARLGGKTQRLGNLGEAIRGKSGQKVIRDIYKLTGGKVDLSKPAIRGAYGYTKKQLEKYIGKSGPLTTAQQDLFKSLRDNLLGIKSGKVSANALVKKDIKAIAKVLNLNPVLKNKKWLYASPFDLKTGKAQIRITRLGLSEEGSLLDLLSGKASIGKGKPEIYVFPKEKIFRASTKLTKLKPITTPSGFVVPKFSSELEVVLGKGYAIKKGKRLSTTIIENDVVPIYELKKIKLSKALRKDISDIKRLNKKVFGLKNKNKVKQLVSEIDKKELALNSKLKKETGLSYFKQTKKYYPLKRKAISLATTSLISSKKISPKYSFSVVKSKSITSGRIRKPKRGPSLPSRPSSPRTSSRKTPSRSSSPVRTPSRPKRPPSKPPYYYEGKSTKPKTFKSKFLRSQRKPKSLSKPIPTFNVYAKVGKKFVKVNKGSLSRQDALNKGSFTVDNTVSKTFKLTPAGRKKKVDTLPKIEQNYYKRAGYKLREYRIKRGKKFGILPKYIEKKKFGIDTKGEKKGLSVARYLKDAYGKAQRTKVRKKLSKNSKAYNIKIKNLKKARRVLRGKK